MTWFSSMIQYNVPHCLPGVELKKLLGRIGITSTSDCSCDDVARQMDKWGPDECEKPERINYVLATMRQNAEKRKLPWSETLARILIRRAIKNARKKKIDH